MSFPGLRSVSALSFPGTCARTAARMSTLAPMPAQAPPAAAGSGFVAPELLPNGKKARAGAAEPASTAARATSDGAPPRPPRLRMAGAEGRLLDGCPVPEQLLELLGQKLRKPPFPFPRKTPHRGWPKGGPANLSM